MKPTKPILYRAINTLLLSCTVFILHAQDFHLSQYEVASQYMNPALTGMYFDEKVNYKINADFREQWRALPSKPYTTGYIAYDMPYQKQWGFGGYIINDQAGTENVNTLSVLMSAAYKITTNGNSSAPYDLTVGVQMGLLQKSTHPADYLYDNQYSTTALGGFDPNLPSGENISKTAIFRYDANTGIYYRSHNKQKKVNYYGGFSIFHITKPNQSFIGQNDRTPMRFVWNGGAYIDVNRQVMINPNALFMLQANAIELNIGAMGYYRIENTEYSPGFGLAYRYEDAIIINIGLKQGTNLCSNIYRISYDINTSPLRNYSGGRGAIEFSVIYSGKRKGRTSSLL